MQANVAPTESKSIFMAFLLPVEASLQVSGYNVWAAGFAMLARALNILCDALIRPICTALSQYPITNWVPLLQIVVERGPTKSVLVCQSAASPYFILMRQPYFLARPRTRNRYAHPLQSVRKSR